MPVGECGDILGLALINSLLYRDDRRSGFICRANRIVAKGRGPYGRHTEAFDAEARALLAGLQAAFSHQMFKLLTNLWACLDNEEVARQVVHRSCATSKELFTQIAQLLVEWPSRHHLASWGSLPTGAAQVV